MRTCRSENFFSSSRVRLSCVSGYCVAEEGLDCAKQGRKGMEKIRKGEEDIPLLNLVKAQKGWNGDKDSNCLLAVADLNLEIDQVSMRAP